MAEELTEAGYADVRVVREALAGEDDAEDAQWVVRVEEESSDPAVAQRLAALAEERDGWYDGVPLE